MKALSTSYLTLSPQLFLIFNTKTSFYSLHHILLMLLAFCFCSHSTLLIFRAFSFWMYSLLLFFYLIFHNALWLILFICICRLDSICLVRVLRHAIYLFIYPISHNFAQWLLLTTHIKISPRITLDLFGIRWISCQFVVVTYFIIKPMSLITCFFVLNTAPPLYSFMLLPNFILYLFILKCSFI
jgi:hypothetical protein